MAFIIYIIFEYVSDVHLVQIYQANASKVKICTHVQYTVDN